MSESPQRLAALANFQPLFMAVVQSCSTIDVRNYELANSARLMAELRPATLKLAAEARSLIASLLATCEILARRYPGARSIPPNEMSRVGDGHFGRAVDAAIALHRLSLDAIEEVAFMAQLELRQRAERLERVTPDCEAATLLGECDSLLRRLRKSLNAVGLTLARVLGVPPLAEYTSELQSSLAVRRALAGFRMRVTKGGEPNAKGLRERFSYIANQIEILVSWDIYSGMRIRDRLLLRGLQQRVLEWLNGNRATVEAGMRLWQDLAACVEMFALVNRRQELVAHDTALLTQAVATLKAQAPDAPIDPAFWKRVRALEGLDVELDALLKRPEPTVQVLLLVLERLVIPAPAPEETPQADDAWG